MNRKSFALSLVVATGVLVSTQLPAGGSAPYEVVDGHKVDATTLQGWRTWRALACERCHGAQQEGLVGPSLVDSLRRLSKEEFEQTVLKGRVDKGMPNFSASKMVNDNIEGLYAYLKGRSDGAIQPGHLEPLQGQAQAQAGR
jgi:mono/diheme cytochrome c family protein